jgi:hypothetical protein
MAPSNATAAFSTLIKRGNGAGTEVFTTVAEVTAVNGLDLKMETDDTTNMGSTGRFKEFVGTLLDAGELSLDVNWLPTDPTQSASAGVLADMLAFTKRNFQMVFPATVGITWSFTALVTGFTGKAPHDKKLSASIKLKISGAPTLV